MTLAAIVSVHNEAAMLPFFLDHYRAEGVDRFFVLDNFSTDGSVDAVRGLPDVLVFTYGRPEQMDDDAKIDAVETVKRSIAASGAFDYVVTPDCDEFLVATGGGTLKDHVSAHAEPLYASTGYCMVEADGDAPLVAGVRLTEQRRHGYPDPNYNKPILCAAEAPVHWAPGFHTATLGGVPFVPQYSDLTLLHYVAHDRETAVARRLRSIERTREVCAARGHGSWKSPLTRADAEAWFTESCNNPNVRRVL